MLTPLTSHDHSAFATSLQGEVVSNHDELMSNFFAQADALALGKTPIELRSENVRAPLLLDLTGWPLIAPSACRRWPGSHTLCPPPVSEP
jgi:Phosphoglucose isomerase